MRNQLIIDNNDIDVIGKVFNQQINHPFVQARTKRNVDIPAQIFTRDDFWLVHLMCLVTTKNKSGVGSAVDTFLTTQPFSLSWEKCEKSENVEVLIDNIFSNLRIRRWKICADFAKRNFNILRQGGWHSLEKWQARLLIQRNQKPDPSHYSLEREAAKDIQDLLIGLGPKQSRNFWQDMGLTRYEIPLDSRIMGWINKYLDFYISSSGLADERFYCQVMDDVRKLALSAGILPCILDAVIFSSYEK
jgi:hypothetical protein